MMLWATLVIAVIMTAVTIGMFLNIPVCLRNLVAIHPLVSFAVNFLISGVILMFTGAGLIAGAANMAASLIFAVYCMLYKHKHGIALLQKEWQPFKFWPLKGFRVQYPAVISKR